MTALELFVSSYPFATYVVVFLGMLIEGESFFVTAGIFAGQGYLRWGTLSFVSLAGMLVGDWAFYLLGKHSKHTRFGAWFVSRFSRAHEWLDRNFASRYTRLAFISKYIYFVNRLTPFLAGWHGFPLRRFLRIHVAAAVVWTGVMLVISHFLNLFVELVGVRYVLRRIEFVFVGFALLFTVGEYALKKLLARKIRGDNNGGETSTTEEPAPPVP